ncbi:MAG: inositol monophosphatase family protein [Planctomycetota bacterium]
MDRETDKLLLAAQKVVREAGLVARENLSRSHRAKAYGEIVTEGDTHVEKHVISFLQGLFPDHGFDSEERGRVNADAEYVWVLDPIDGTRYYAKDVPLYSVSLALEQRKEGGKELVLGIVYSPEFERMYCASTGRGATLNGKTIRCSGEDDLEKAQICLEIPNRDCPGEQLAWALEKMSVLIEHAFRVRIIGVGALGLCFCASGGFDAYVNLGWWKDCDIAAGQVIVREAGGEFFFLGKEGRQIVAGPAALCSKIRDVLGISSYRKV